MKTQFKKIIIMPLILLSLVSLSFIVYGFYLIIHLDFSGLTIFGGLLLVWIGIVIFNSVFGYLKSLSIEGDSIKIKKLLSISSIEFSLKGLKYSEFTWISKFGAASGIMIKFSNDMVETIGYKEYSNSQVFIDYIKSIGTIDNSIKKPSLTQYNKAVFILGLIIFLAFILFSYQSDK